MTILGIVWDNKLKFDQHVKYLHGKIFPKLKTLGRVRSKIGQGTAVYLYNSLMNPCLLSMITSMLAYVRRTSSKFCKKSCICTCLKCDKHTPQVEMYWTSGIDPLDVQWKRKTAGIVYLGLNQESTPLVYLTEFSIEQAECWGLRYRKMWLYQDLD